MGTQTCYHVVTGHRTNDMCIRHTFLLPALFLALLIGCGDPDARGVTPSGGGGEPQVTSASSSSAGGGGAATTASVGAGGGIGGEGGTPATVYGFPDAWPNGTSCGTESEIFVHRYADDTFILRQSLCTSFEGPFMYLFFGDDKALLQDTGDGGVPLAATLAALIDERLGATGQSSIELVVTHSHAHGDHTAGDGALAALPNTVVVGHSASAVASFFGITSWPTQSATYDLGGRILDVVPIPGHQSAHIALFDRRHALLLTGDTLYPGRLYIQSFSDYRASTARLVDFVNAGVTPTWVLGTHIEMTTTPGQDYSFGATSHPNEHALELTFGHVEELDAAVQAMGSSPSYQAHDDFIIVP